METIALVGPYGTDVRPILEKRIEGRFELVFAPTEADLPSAFAAEYVILRVLRMTADSIAAMPRLRLIQRWGVGFDKVDIEAAGRRGIPVAVTPGANASAVSELAILLILALYRNLVQLHEGTTRAIWQNGKFVDSSFMIKGKTVGLVGCGAIGLQVAHRVQAFGAKVIYHDLRRLSEEDEARKGLRYLGLDELLSSADIVSLHLPLLDTTRHLLGARELALMKSSAILINTSRGEIVDTAALAEALDSGRLRGAGLDVFETEPIAVGNPLLGKKNVVLTPHVGGNTSDMSGDMIEICLDHITAVAEGRPLPQNAVVNSQFLP